MRLLLVEDDRLLADGLTSQLERRDSAWIPPPPPEKRRRWPIEEHDLNEVLGNLLDNAGKWSARFVELDLQEDGKGFAITVEDDGPGIPPDALDTLGTRGLRLDEQTPGHGLGLAIVREITDRYGGTLNFSSGSTGGFKATVHFPGTTGGDKAVKIGELAKTTAIPVETIRYYEKIGLLPEPDRDNSGYRSYRNAHLDRLLFIKRCRNLDMAQDEIRELIRLAEKPEADCSEVDALLARHLNHVRERLKELASLEETLEQLQEACTNGRTVRECGILGGLSTEFDTPEPEDRHNHVPRTHGNRQN